jgi:hypothetical protein
MARRDTVQASRPLGGEDIETIHWEDARYWIGVHDDLLNFKLGAQRINAFLDGGDYERV